jgi:endonuclease/exonuclease/phosphatase family metal-dependent hydrolase
MALASPRSTTAEENLAYLRDLMTKHGVDVALLNEAPVAFLRRMNEDGHQRSVFSERGTVGLDRWTDEHGVRKPKVRSGWSSAIVTEPDLALVPLAEDDVRAVSPSATNARRPDVPFTPSRPGSWVAGSVSKEGETLTCISLYGLMDELSDASMHRSLSEVSPAFSDPARNDLLVLAGDFNIGTSLEGEDVRTRSRLVLERIEAYGLTDVLRAGRSKQGLGPLAGCPCADDPCQHTLTRLIPSSRGRDTPWTERTPFQVDYIYASPALAARLEGVIEIPPEEWEPHGDHAPLMAQFDVS